MSSKVQGYTPGDAVRNLAAAKTIPREISIARLQGQLTTFERLFHMKTSVMRSRILNGTLEETEVICQWLHTDTRLKRLLAAG